MCSGGGGGVVSNTLANPNTGRVIGQAAGIDPNGGTGSDPSAGSRAAAGTPTTAPNSDGTETDAAGKQSSLLITRNRRRATGTASATGGGSGLNIPT